MALIRTDIAGHKGVMPAGTGGPSGLRPADLQSAYNLPSGPNGKGETVAIVDAYDDPNALADVNTYRQQYGLPALPDCSTDASPCFRKVAQDGSQTNLPPPNAGWAEEESLDVDMVSAVCPNCSIDLVEASGTLTDSLGASVNEAVALGAKFVSNSYGTAACGANGCYQVEDPSDPATDAAYYNHPGVAITASAGDDDYGVGFPAASPHVTAVGGTSLVAASTARGWSESVWNTTAGEGTGSGCSQYEPKPSWQADTGCKNRTVADVSAVADPATGVAVYDSYGSGGWTVFGGTSVSSPIIASAYALAGTPKASNYPAQYPYAAYPSGLNDVTSGNDVPNVNGGTCSPPDAYWCTAGQGYDGPTGLGTPDGISAFSAFATGDIEGTVTDSNRQPIAGAAVDAGGGYVATTGSDGGYKITVPPGTYTVTASDFSYQDQSASGITVTSDGQSVTHDFTLAKAPEVTVSGTVRDGSGHGWPLYATVQVKDTPEAAVKTDPVTGRYQFALPAGHTYTFQAASMYYGYQAASQPVQVGASDTTADIPVTIDPSLCGRYTAGIGYNFPGTTETFDSRTAPAGWTVTDNAGSGHIWRFDNPNGEQNQTGFNGGTLYSDSANYATLDTFTGDQNTPMDAYLTGPDTDLSTATNPALMWDNFSNPIGKGAYSVDVSTDGGGTWQTVWKHGSDRDPDGYQGYFWTGRQTVPLGGFPWWQAAKDHSQVRVRFHFTGTAVAFLSRAEWQVDNVLLGSGSCQPVPGVGLVTGRVGDKNNGGGVNQANVISAGRSATSGPGWFGPGYGDGFYAFAVPAGQQQVTASRFGYRGVTQPATVTAGQVTKADFTLAAGQLKISAPATATAQLGGSPVSTTMTVTNTGTAPAAIAVQQADGGVTAQHASAAGQAVPYGQWIRGSDYPVATAGAASATDPGTGIVYSSGGGAGGVLTAWDPATGTYNNYLPNDPYNINPDYAAFINGQYYAVGGGQVASYSPRTGSWSQHTTAPGTSLTGSSYATLNGRIYVIGGCTGAFYYSLECRSDVRVYDPAGGRWDTAASYPEPVTQASCGTIRGEIYCAGGNNGKAAISHGYAYNPVTGTWRTIAPMPAGLWNSATITSNGKLLISSGSTATTPAPGGRPIDNYSQTTGKGFSYDPASNTWSALPEAPGTLGCQWSGTPATCTPAQVGLVAESSVCGMSTIGGTDGAQINLIGAGTEFLYHLPGYGNCDDNTGVPWLSATKPATIAPGQTVKLALNVNPADKSVSQPGTYVAHLELNQDTPYDTTPTDLTAQIAPASGWVKVTGTVTGSNCYGTTTPLPGATIQFQGTSSGTPVTELQTGAGGHYTAWVDRSEPVEMLVSADGWQPQVASLNQTATITLRTDFPCATTSARQHNSTAHVTGGSQ